MSRPIRQGSYRKSGFTLAETLVSVATMALLMAGMGSAILVASNALPDRDDPVDAAIRAADAVDQIAGELRYASAISVGLPTSLAFDVNRSGTNNTIRYAWSGTPGDPLTRIYDGLAPVNLIDDVYDFALTYETGAGGTKPPEEVESVEVVLIGYQPSVSSAGYRVNDVNWIGQYFLPSLPADAVSWKVTRVMVMAMVDGPTAGVTTVQLRQATGGNLPSATVLEEHPMAESDLSGIFLWQTFLFDTVFGLSPGAGLCIVLAPQVPDAYVCQVQFDPGAGSGLVTTSNAGSTWTSAASASMSYYIYGTVTTLGSAPVEATVYTSARIALQAGSHSVSRVESAVKILNQPDVQ